MAQLGLYGGTVTAGATNGTLIATSDLLKYTGNKGALGDTVPYALRASLGANVYNVNLSVMGTNPDWIELSKDGETWAASLTFDNISDVNVLFFARANIPTGAAYNQVVLNSFFIKYIETVGDV